MHVDTTACDAAQRDATLLADVHAQLRTAFATKRTLVLSDIDGTITWNEDAQYPFCEDPFDVRVHPSIRTTFSRLAAREDVHIRFVTGGTAERTQFILQESDLVGIDAECCYGTELLQWKNDGTTRIVYRTHAEENERNWETIFSALEDTLARALRTSSTAAHDHAVRARVLLSHTNGHDADALVWCEQKGDGVAFHPHAHALPEVVKILYRSVVEVVQRLPQCAGLVVRRNMGNVELRTASAADKSDVVRRLVGELHPEFLLVCGDDKMDIPAFIAARDARRVGVHALAVVVQNPPNTAVAKWTGTSPEVAGYADIVLASPLELAKLLQNSM